MAVIISFQVFADIEQTGAGLTVLRVVSSSIEEAEKIDLLPVMDENGKEYDPENHRKVVALLIRKQRLFFAIRPKAPANNSEDSYRGSLPAFVASFISGKTIQLANRQLKKYCKSKITVLL